MAGTNDFNLVISDEEGANLYSGRSHNTLSSPNAQFMQQAQGNVYMQPYPHKNMTSPVSQETFPSYDREYGAYHSEGQVPFHAEDIGTKTNSEYYSTVQPVSNSGSSTKAQFTKKPKKQPHDNTSEDDFHQQAAYGGTFSANSFQHDTNPREYMSQEAAYELYGNQMDHHGNERYAEDYGDMDDQEVRGEEDQRNQSLRDSQISGPVRYSKMTEEEAALAFENRKKELFSTYLKKGPKKNASNKGSEPQSANIREVPSPEDPYGRGGVSGFVIYNNKSPSSQPSSAQLKGQSGDERGGPSLKRKPSVERRDSPMNKVNLSKQRKDSPGGRRTPTKPNSQRGTPKSQRQKATAQQKPTINTRKTPREEQGTNKVVVDYKRPSANSRRKEDEYNSRGTYDENMGTSESRNTHNRTPHVQQNENNAYGMNKIEKKNREILQDINNLDEEIYRLESESTRKSHQQANGNREGFTQYEYMQQFEANASHNGQGQNRQGKSDSERRSRSRSMQKENAENYQSPGQNVRDQREKRQRINELNAEKGMRYTDTSQRSVKDQLQNSYMVLNEKGFEQHSDYLYERALIKMKSRDSMQEQSKEAKAKEEMMACTFSPQIKTKGDPRIEDIVTRTRNWQVEKERQILAAERQKIEKELSQCTFYPNGQLDRESITEYNPNSFYKRNIEWIKRKEAENKRRENEQYKSIMSVPDKPKSQANLSFSRVNDSQSIHEHRVASPMGSTRGKLQRTPSNRSLRSARNAERPGSAKKVERPASARNINRPGSAQKREKREDSVGKNRPSYKRPTQPNSAKKEDKKSARTSKTEKTEKTTIDTQESVDNANAKKEANMQSQILESYAILDGLQNMLQFKEKEKQEKIAKDKQGVTTKLKTVTLQKTSTAKAEPKPQPAKSRYVPSPTRSQPRLSAKLPVSSPGYNPQDVEQKMQSITVKKNRYFIEERPVEKPVSRTSVRERSNSRTSKARPLTPSKEYGSNQYLKTGSYAAAANQTKKRGESPYKSKPVQSHYDASVSKSNHSEAMISPFQSMVTSPQAYGLFGFSPSPRNQQLNFVSKGLVSPNSQNLEKKYLSLLDQVSRVTKQLDHVSAENSVLQQDISTMQKKQMNKNMLYSQ